LASRARRFTQKEWACLRSLVTRNIGFQRNERSKYWMDLSDDTRLYMRKEMLKEVVELDVIRDKLNSRIKINSRIKKKSRKKGSGDVSK